MANPVNLLKKKKDVAPEPIVGPESSPVKYLLRIFDFMVVREGERKLDKLLNNLYVVSYKDFVSMFEEYLEQYDYKEDLVIEICKNSPISKRCIANFLAALYVICSKYNISYIKTVEKLFIDDFVFVNGEAELVSQRSLCPEISFADFNYVFEAAREYGFSVSEARKVICTIFKDFFFTFIENAEERDIKMLKHMDESLGDIQPFNDGFMEVDFGEYLYDGFTATRGKYYFACTDIKYAKYISKYYPELFSIVCTRTLINLIGLAGEMSNYDDDEVEEEEFDEYYKVKELLQYMADYAKYHSVEFEIKKYWKDIISSIMKYCDGITLNLAVEVFSEHFNISMEEIKEYIARYILLLLNGDKTKYYDEYGGFKFNEFNIEASKIAKQFGYNMLDESANSKWENIICLLSNPIVFEIVMAERSHFIYDFNYRAEY
ncbi:MAG: hypothetical protein J6C46_04820 [Clostridia bacterium]|nr:hypothetical protein [Clostridia bacterium]